MLRRPLFILGLGAALLALVTFPAQHLPVLFRDDTRMIGLSLTLLAAGATAAAAGAARRGGSLARTVTETGAIGAAVVAAAMVGYKLLGALGGPSRRTAWPLVFVPMATAVGFGIGKILKRVPRAVSAALAGAVALFGVLPLGVAVGSVQPGLRPQVCRTVKDVRYCFFPGYEGLVDDWSAVVESVVAQVPADVARDARSLPVIQSDRERARAPNALAAPLLGWGRPGGGEANAKATLGLDVAFTVLGLGVALKSQGPRFSDECAPRANAVVQRWLAGQQDAGTRHQAEIIGAFGDNVTGTEYANPSGVGLVGGRYAQQLLRRDRDAVGRAIRDHWDELTRPDAPVSVAVDLFDLRPVERPTAQECANP